MFYTCAENGFPIAPVAIEFKDANLAWVNREMFVPHAFGAFWQEKVRNTRKFWAKFQWTDAEQLLEDVRNWTQEECYRLRKIDGFKELMIYLSLTSCRRNAHLSACSSIIIEVGLPAP